MSKIRFECYGPNDMIIAEDRKDAIKMVKKDRYVSVSWAFFDLGQKLKYKAARAGSRAIEVDPAYTSQRCPKCGHIEKKATGTSASPCSGAKRAATHPPMTALEA